MFAPRSRTSVGSATLTIVLSITMIRRLTHSTTSASQRRRSSVVGVGSRGGVHRCALCRGAGREEHGQERGGGGDDQRTAGAEHRVLALDVDADRGGDRPAECPQRAQRRDPGEREAADPRAQHDCLRGSDRKPADRALDDEVAHAGAVAHCGGADPEPDRESGTGRGDPLSCRRTVRPQAPRLDGAEDHAGDGSADERRGEPVDRAGDELGDEAAEREAEEGGEPAQRTPLPRRWLGRACVHDVHGVLLSIGSSRGEARVDRHDVTATATGADEVAVRRSWTRISTPKATSHTLHRT